MVKHSSDCIHESLVNSLAGVMVCIWVVLCPDNDDAVPGRLSLKVKREVEVGHN